MGTTDRGDHRINTSVHAHSLLCADDPRSCDVVGGDAKTGAEFLEDTNQQPLGHHVGELLSRGDMQYAGVAERDTLTNKVNVEFDGEKRGIR